MDQKSKSQHQLIMAGISIIIAAVAFFAGAKYQATKTPAFNRNRPAGMGQANGSQPRNGGDNILRGEIGSITDDTLTIKLTDGSSKIVFLSGSTTISKTEAGTVEDLSIGNQIVIFGQTNSDGSVTAQNIQLGATNPADFRPYQPNSN